MTMTNAEYIAKVREDMSYSQRCDLFNSIEMLCQLIEDQLRGIELINGGRSNDQILLEEAIRQLNEIEDERDDYRQALEWYEDYRHASDMVGGIGLVARAVLLKHAKGGESK